MISIKQAAKIIGVTQEMVRRYIRDGRLKATVVDRTPILDRKVVTRFAKVRNEFKGKD